MALKVHRYPKHDCEQKGIGWCKQRTRIVWGHRDIFYGQKQLLGPGIEPGANAWEALRLPLPHPSCTTTGFFDII